VIRVRPPAAAWLAGWFAVAIAAVLVGGTVVGLVPLGAATAGLVVRLAGVAVVGTTLLLTLLPAGWAVGSAGGPTTGRAGASEAGRVGRRAIRATVVLAGGWLLAALVAAAVGAAAAVDRPLAVLDAETALRWLGTFSAGRGLVVTAGCALVVAVGAALWSASLSAGRAGPPAALLLGLALVGVVAGPVTGHGADQRLHELAVVSFGLHALAAAAWVGGLGAILALAVGHRRLLGELLGRFAPVALGCLAAVAVTGVLNAVIQLPGLDALIATGYGRLVLAKAGCLLVIGVIASRVRRRMATGGSVPALAVLEVAVMAAALGPAAALASGAPP
jgi:putative copper resistance protein D